GGATATARGAAARKADSVPKRRVFMGRLLGVVAASVPHPGPARQRSPRRLQARGALAWTRLCARVYRPHRAARAPSLHRRRRGRPMSWLSELRLIPLFSVYLVVVFALSTGVRLRQYGAVLSLVRRMPERWPNLLRLVRQHLHLFLTWGTVLP